MKYIKLFENLDEDSDLQLDKLLKESLTPIIKEGIKKVHREFEQGSLTDAIRYYACVNGDDIEYIDNTDLSNDWNEYKEWLEGKCFNIIDDILKEEVVRRLRHYPEEYSECAEFINKNIDLPEDLFYLKRSKKTGLFSDLITQKLIDLNITE